MAKGIFDNMGGQNAGSATKMGQTVKAGRIDRPKYKKVTRDEASAPPKGVKTKNEALYNSSLLAREIALSKAKIRSENKAAGRPANYGMDKTLIARGSTKKMTIAKAQPRYQSPGGNSSGGYLKKITNDMEKR